LLGVLSCGIGALLWLFAAAPIPQLPQWLGMLLREAAGGWVPRSLAAAGGGLAVFVLLALLLPAGVESVAMGGLRRRLGRLAAWQAAGKEVAPEVLREAFSRSPLAEEGASYAAGLWRGRAALLDAAPTWRSTVDPEPLFRHASGARIAAAALAGQLSLLVAASGLALVIGARYLAGAGFPAPLSVGSVPLAPTPERLPWILLAAGIALFVLSRCLGLVTLQLVTEIVALARRLFPPGHAEYIGQQLATAASGAEESRMMAVGAAGETLRGALATAADELKTMLGGHDRRIGASVASSVQRATQPIASSLQETLARLETENGKAAERLLSGVLASFLGEFQERFGQHALALNDVLAQTRSLADGLHGTFAAAEERLQQNAAALGDRMLDGLGNAMTAAIAAQTEALRGMLERVDAMIAQTGSRVEEFGEHTDAALAAWSDRIGDLGSTMVARGTEELKRTAASFAQLHAILETLSISVLPAVNRLIVTQERLQAAIDADRQTSQSMSAAAADLGEAVRIAHGMVERQMMLTRDLAQLPGRGLGDPLPAAVSDDLAQAIEDLRSEADRERQSLPRL
jgi:hypothetical protein